MLRRSTDGSQMASATRPAGRLNAGAPQAAGNMATTPSQSTPGYRVLASVSPKPPRARGAPVPPPELTMPAAPDEPVGRTRAASTPVPHANLRHGGLSSPQGNGIVKPVSPSSLVPENADHRTALPPLKVLLKEIDAKAPTKSQLVGHGSNLAAARDQVLYKGSLLAQKSKTFLSFVQREHDAMRLEMEHGLSQASTYVESLGGEFERFRQTLRLQAAALMEKELQLERGREEFLRKSEQSKRELEQAQLEWNKKRQTAIKSNIVQKTAIRLDVGGRHFTVSSDVLTSISDTWFESCFGGSFPVNTSENGAYVIDRDGSQFAYILQYFRDRDAVELPDELHHLRQLRQEAIWYNLRGLEDLVQAKVTRLLQEREDLRNEELASKRGGTARLVLAVAAGIGLGVLINSDAGSRLITSVANAMPSTAAASTTS